MVELRSSRGVVSRWSVAVQEDDPVAACNSGMSDFYYPE
jgi:hypothetical protein